MHAAIYVFQYEDQCSNTKTPTTGDIALVMYLYWPCMHVMEGRVL